MPYVSRHIIRNKADYYNGLLAVTTDGAWEPWILYMLRGVAETALIEETAERMRTHGHAMQHPFFTKPGDKQWPC